MKTNICGELLLPPVNGREIAPGIVLIGEPSPRPDLGPNRLACLADVDGTLCVVELSFAFRDRVPCSVPVDCPA